MPVVGFKNPSDNFFQVTNIKNFILDETCVLKTDILDADQLVQVPESGSRFPSTDLRKKWVKFTILFLIFKKQF